jgi:hypothetical protein
LNDAQAEVEAQNMAIAQLEHEKNVLEARQVKHHLSLQL